MKRLAKIFAFCALGTAIAVGCGDDDDNGGGGGDGGSGGTAETGGSAGAETGGAATGGGGGLGGAQAEGVCAITCTTATVEDDCGPDDAFNEQSCVDGFCKTTSKPCNDQAGDEQNCDIDGQGLFSCIEVDSVPTCLKKCDPDAVDDSACAEGGECTGDGSGDDADVHFCVYPTPAPKCGIVGNLCPQLLGQGGAGGEGGGAPASLGICSAAGTCVCSDDSQCTATGYACKK